MSIAISDPRIIPIYVYIFAFVGPRPLQKPPVVRFAPVLGRSSQLMASLVPHSDFFVCLAVPDALGPDAFVGVLLALDLGRRCCGGSCAPSDAEGLDLERSFSVPRRVRRGTLRRLGGCDPRGRRLAVVLRCMKWFAVVHAVVVVVVVWWFTAVRWSLIVDS